VSLGLALPQTIVELSRALTECLGNRLADTVLHRLKTNLAVLSNGYPRLVSASEALSESTVKELRALRSALDVYAHQLAEIDEGQAIEHEVSVIHDQLNQSEPWKGYADARPASGAILTRYRARREQFAREERAVFDDINARLKSRTEFAGLKADTQDEVLSLVSGLYQDIDLDAAQPSLVSLSRLSGLLREAEDRAQRRIDLEANKERKGERIQTVKTGLRNRVLADEAELDKTLAELRSSCLPVFASGDKVRFSE